MERIAGHINLHWQMEVSILQETNTELFLHTQYNKVMETKGCDIHLFKYLQPWSCMIISLANTETDREICGSHGSDYENDNILGCDAEQSGRY